VTPDVGLRERKKAATRLALYPNLLSSITGAALKAAFRVWDERRHPASLATLIDEAFDRLVVQPFPAGFRTP
jgi:hypothetical protein